MSNNTSDLQRTKGTQTVMNRMNNGRLETLKNRLAPAAAELKVRQQVAFEILHQQVEIVKHSPTVQIAVSTAISGLIITGNLVSAASLAGAWFFSKPLTHAVASGVGLAGLADSRLAEALLRLQAEPEPVRIANLVRG